MTVNDRTITLFRVDKVQPPKKVGDLSDITDGTKSIGAAIDVALGNFAPIRVTDLSEELEEDLRSRTKYIRVLTPADSIYAEWLTGQVTVTEAQLLAYIEEV